MRDFRLSWHVTVPRSVDVSKFNFIRDKHERHPNEKCFGVSDIGANVAYLKRSRATRR